MKDSEKLSNLEEVVNQMGIMLRYEKGDFRGGFCRVGDKKMLIVNSALDLQVKISLISHELSKLDLSETYVVPAVRLLIENCKDRQNQPEV